MSRSITVTIKHAVADTLARHMDIAKEGLPPGVRVSKSNYVSASIEAALIRDGYEIKCDEQVGEPNPHADSPPTSAQTKTNPYEPL